MQAHCWARGLAILSAVAMLGGCAEHGEVAMESVAGLGAHVANEHPQDENVAAGKQHYNRSDYGLAEQDFRNAVESNPKSAAAWLGLAASYDQLRRFDLAEHAYAQLVALQGRTPTVLNNLGYHYMLRGDLRQARVNLNEALAKDPSNPQIKGNIRLLDTWKTADNTSGETLYSK